jgi:hypothetical protein
MLCFQFGLNSLCLTFSKLLALEHFLLYRIFNVCPWLESKYWKVEDTFSYILGNLRNLPGKGGKYGRMYNSIFTLDLIIGHTCNSYFLSVIIQTHVWTVSWGLDAADLSGYWQGRNRQMILPDGSTSMIFELCWIDIYPLSTSKN